MTSVTPMIERLARHLTHETDATDPAANHRVIGDDGTVYDAGIPRWHAHIDDAREILRLIREPDEGMVDEANGSEAILHGSGPDGGTVRVEFSVAWRAMVDAALGRFQE